MTQQEYNIRVIELFEDLLSIIPYTENNRRKKDALYAEISTLNYAVRDIGRSAEDE